MKQITLEKVRDTLRDLAPAVEVPERDMARARVAIERMLAVTADRTPMSVTQPDKRR